jgi:hypothetical protein
MKGRDIAGMFGRGLLRLVPFAGEAYSIRDNDWKWYVKGAYVLSMGTMRLGSIVLSRDFPGEGAGTYSVLTAGNYVNENFL